MKILRKPKLLAVGCRRCGCLFTPKMRNLTVCKDTKIKDEVHCPSCYAVNKANFEMFQPIESEESEQ